MFDEITARLIRTAAPLEGLDIDRLPQLLTEAYARIIEVRLGATTPEIAPSYDWTETLLWLRRVAETYEGLAVFLPKDNPHREACAFVAGSAHFTLSQARRARVLMGSNVEIVPSLTRHSIGPEISACLLFLIGGHQADATEASKAFVPTESTSIRAELLNGISALASGEGAKVFSFARLQLTASRRLGLDYLEVAAETLWFQLAGAVQLLCRRVLGETNLDPVPVIDGVLERIARAQSEVVIGTMHAMMRVPLEGPYHLARLLKFASSVLLGAAVTSASLPDGVDSTAWSVYLRHSAKQHPFLWRNHSEGIGHGFLASGCSFVFTFPTGAGKTTLTTLRIAAEVLRGRKVVFLAPTRALVDQVSRDLDRSLRPIAPDVVRGRFLEDFGERAGTLVYVQTPEQCLAYLSHEPSGHMDVGLVVVDECHQLSGTTNITKAKLPDRRAIDAMWTLLSVLQRSPEADVVLISAMVRNGREVARWLQAATGRPATVLDLPWKPTRQIRGFLAYDRTEIDELESQLYARRRQGAWRREPSAAEKRGVNAVPLGIFCHTQVWDAASSFAAFPLLSASVALGVSKTWRLTANRNIVAGRLLAAMVKAGIPPLVFTQNLLWTTTIAKIGAENLRNEGVRPRAMTTDESSLFAAAAEELGDVSLVELPVEGLVGVHHGLLLPAERQAMESAFGRSDGLPALVATPTVAQGINLPAEAVIIAGDDRWEGDIDEGGPETLAVHELLNAAGRAGRAGRFAHGIVIDIPGTVHSVFKDGDTLGLSNLEHAMSLFGVPDQCLDIVDPLTQVIDRIAHEGAVQDVGQYLVRRAAGLEEGVLVRILGSAFGNALRTERDVLAATQAALLRTARDMTEHDPDTEVWREFASQTAASPEAIAGVAAIVPSLDDIAMWDFSQLLNFVTNILVDAPGMLFGLIDPGSFDFARILPPRKKTAEQVPQWERRWQDALKNLLPKWLSGEPLNAIGAILHKHRGKDSKAKPIHLGRRFAIQTSGGIGYGASLVCRVAERKLGAGLAAHLAAWFELVPGCLREGFDHPDKLLLFWHYRHESGLHPRVIVHREFGQIEGSIPKWIEMPNIDARRSVIRRLLSRAKS